METPTTFELVSFSEPPVLGDSVKYYTPMFGVIKGVVESVGSDGALLIVSEGNRSAIVHWRDGKVWHA